MRRTATVERNISIDVLRIALAFMVIGKHTNFLYEINPTVGYFMNDGLFRTAVPLFITISGFYFSPSLQRSSFSVWLRRYIFIYIFWMLVYSKFWLSLSNAVFFNLFIGIKHLWYMPGFIGAGVVMYFLKEINSKFLLATACILFLIGFFIQYAGNYHLFNGSIMDEYFNFNWVHKNFLFYCFPFFAAGHLVGKHKLHEKISKKSALLLSLIGLFCIFSECTINFILIGVKEGFANLITLPFAVSFIFIFFLKIEIKGKSKKLSEHSSSIYFIHYWIIIFLQNVVLLHGIKLTLLTAVLSVSASFFVIQINRKMPFRII